MATPKKLHYRRYIGIAVVLMVMLLICVASGFTGNLLIPQIGGISPALNSPSGLPLQTPTSTPTYTPSQTPTSSLGNSLTPPLLINQTPSIPTSEAGYYLPYPDNLTLDGNLVDQAGNGSEIFLVSANASYGVYPYPTVTNHNGVILAKNGEPCVIINVTIRSDYSTKNPPPYLTPENSTSVYVFLTAQVSNGENKINATDITPPVGFANGGAFASLSSGESATLTIYLATNNTNITSFQIVMRIISGIPPP